MPQWIAREYLARKGNSKFSDSKLTESKCSILGYALNSIKVDGNYIPKEFLEVNKQEDVGEKAYDAGALELTNFFKDELKKFLSDDLEPLGRKIIECCLNDGSIEDYKKLLKMNY